MNAALKTAVRAGIVIAWMTGATACGEDLRQGLVQMCQLGGSLRTLVQAEQQFATLREMHGNDARVYYTYALVQLQHRRWPEAAKALATAVRLEPRNVKACEARVWVAVLSKDYGLAMAGMKHLANLISAGDAERIARCDGLQVAAFLGQICGFLEGPNQNNVDGAALAACQEHIASQLSGELTSWFQQGRNEVSEKFRQYSEQIVSIRAQNVAAEEESRRQRRMDLDVERQQAWERIGMMEDRRAQVRQDAAQQQARIAEAGSQTTEDAAYQSSRLPADWSFRTEQCAQAQKRERDELRRLDRAERTAHVLVRRTNRDERRLNGPLTGASNQVLSLSGKLVSLRTYVMLPVLPETEMANVLSSCDEMTVAMTW